MPIKLDFLYSQATYYGSKVVLALVVLVIGLWVIKLLVKSLKKVINKSIKDLTLSSFVESLTGILLKIFLIISVISILGIQVASFIAVLGAAGLAIGFALQGSLSNLAAGVLLLFFRPFRVGETLEFKGMTGEVKEIQIMHTILMTGDGVKVIVPNSMLSSSNIVVLQK